MKLVRGQYSLTLLVLSVASCSSPVAGLNPTGEPSAPAVSATTPPTPSPVSPAAAPTLPPAPPVAADARVRLTGVVLFNSAPVPGASVVAQDLATGKALVLAPWSSSPAAHRLLQATQTDAEGRFDLAAPRMESGQLIKLVVNKGSQTFTAVFNDRGQAIGADEVTTARYTLRQGQATTVEIRLRLTAASTAATQAFEGILKLTFQLPADKSEERRSAALEAARQAAQAVSESLAKNFVLAGRIVSSLNSAGDVTQLEAFRTALVNLGVFTPLFQAVQGELRAISIEKLTSSAGLDPIRARQFPLDDVVISPSGFLGFSGQTQPITLAGQVQSNFVPSAGRGGGSSSTSGTGSGSGAGSGSRIVELLTGLSFSSIWNGLARVSLGAGDNRLAYVTGDQDVGMFDLVSGGVPAATPSIDFGAGPTLYCLAQAPNAYATRTLYVAGGGAPSFVGAYNPVTGATAAIPPSGTGSDYASMAAGSRRFYAMNWNNDAVQWFDLDAPSALQGTVQAGSQPWILSGSDYGSAMTIFQGPASPTLFIGSQTGTIYAAEEDGLDPPRIVATGLGGVRGLAFATPTLYVASSGAPEIYALNVNENSPATSVFLAVSDLTAAGISGTFKPYGLALDSDTSPTYLYVMDGNPPPPPAYRLLAPPPAQGRILRVRISP